MANDDSGNAIIVFDIYSDGTVVSLLILYDLNGLLIIPQGYKTKYFTGGNGGTQVYTPMLADALRSEGSVYVWHDRLFQVNVRQHFAYSEQVSDPSVARLALTHSACGILTQ